MEIKPMKPDMAVKMFIVAVFVAAILLFTSIGSYFMYRHRLNKLFYEAYDQGFDDAKSGYMFHDIEHEWYEEDYGVLLNNKLYIGDSGDRDREYPIRIVIPDGYTYRVSIHNKTESSASSSAPRPSAIFTYQTILPQLEIIPENMTLPPRNDTVVPPPPPYDPDTSSLQEQAESRFFVSMMLIALSNSTSEQKIIMPRENMTISLYDIGEEQFVVITRLSEEGWGELSLCVVTPNLGNYVVFSKTRFNENGTITVSWTEEHTPNQWYSYTFDEGEMEEDYDQ